MAVGVAPPGRPSARWAMCGSCIQISRRPLHREAGSLVAVSVAPPLGHILARRLTHHCNGRRRAELRSTGVELGLPSHFESPVSPGGAVEFKHVRRHVLSLWSAAGSVFRWWQLNPRARSRHRAVEDVEGSPLFRSKRVGDATSVCIARESCVSWRSACSELSQCSAGRVRLLVQTSGRRLHREAESLWRSAWRRQAVPVLGGPCAAPASRSVAGVSIARPRPLWRQRGAASGSCRGATSNPSMQRTPPY